MFVKMFRSIEVHRWRAKEKRRLLCQNSKIYILIVYRFHFHLFEFNAVSFPFFLWQCLFLRWCVLYVQLYVQFAHEQQFICAMKLYKVRFFICSYTRSLKMCSNLIAFSKFIHQSLRFVRMYSNGFFHLENYNIKTNTNGMFM